MVYRIEVVGQKVGVLIPDIQLVLASPSFAWTGKDLFMVLFWGGYMNAARKVGFTRVDLRCSRHNAGELDIQIRVTALRLALFNT
jgi:hypothetical protein